MDAAIGLVATAVQVGIGVLLALAGFGKATRWHEFKGTLDAYRLLPSALVRPAASAIVVAEIVTGFALVAGWEAGFFALAACALFACFGAAMALNLARGRRSIDCGFFRGVRQPLEWRLVARNAYRFEKVRAKFGSINYSMADDDPQRWIQAVPAAATLVILYFALNAVWALDASRTAAFKRS